MEHSLDRDGLHTNRHRGMLPFRRPATTHEPRTGSRGRYRSEQPQHEAAPFHPYDRIRRAVSYRRRSHTMFDSARYVSVAGGGISQVGAGGVVVHVHQPRTALSPSQRRRLRILVSGRRTATRRSPNRAACSSSAKSDSEIYYDQLFTKRRGIPLWLPGPSKRLPKAYRRKGPDIGDVGILTELGGFCFLFNVFEEANGEINRGKVPAGFTPLRRVSNGQLDTEAGLLNDCDVQEHKVYMNGSWIGSKDVKEEISSAALGFTFTTRASEGAILTLPLGSSSRDATQTGLLRQYAAANLESWYKYVNHVLHVEVKNGELHLVKGCDKSSSWGIATFRHEENSLEHEEVKEMHFKPHRQGGGGTYAWSCMRGGSGRVGPDESEMRDLLDFDDPDAMEVEGQVRREPSVTLIENQCLFVRTINPQYTEDEWDRVMGDQIVVEEDNSDPTHHHTEHAARRGNSRRQGEQSGAGPSFRGPQSHSNWEMGIQFTPMDGQPKLNVHPSSKLNHALSEKYPEANIVVTEDEDWMWATDQCSDKSIADDVLRFKEVTVKDGILYLKRFSPPVLHDMPKLKSVCTLKPHPQYYSAHGNLAIVVGRTLFKLRRQNLSRHLKRLISESPGPDSKGNIIIEHLDGDQFAHLLEQQSTHPNTKRDSRKMKRREGVFTPFKPQNSDVIILVIGTTGAGKSTFINAVAGYEASRTSDELHSCTREVKPIACQSVDGRRVVMVDTPGFNDTNMSDMDVFRLVAMWLKETYEGGITLSGVLLLHRITDNRLTGAARSLLDIFKNTCGPDALRNALLITTMWDEIDEEQGSEREQELAEKFWSPMTARGARFRRFLNTTKSALEIVSLLGKDASQYPLLLQVELVDQGKELARTTAGKSVFGWLHDLLEGIQRRIEAIGKKLQRAKKRGDIVQKHHLQGQMKTAKEEKEYVDKELKWYQPEPIRIHDAPWTSAPYTDSPISISCAPSASSLLPSSLAPWMSSGSTSSEAGNCLEPTVEPPSTNPTPSPSIMPSSDDWVLLTSADKVLCHSVSSIDATSVSTGVSSNSTTSSPSSYLSSFGFKNLRRSSSTTTQSKGSSQKNLDLEPPDPTSAQHRSVQSSVPVPQKFMHRISIKRRKAPVESSNLAIQQVLGSQKAATS